MSYQGVQVLLALLEVNVAVVMNFNSVVFGSLVVLLKFQSGLEHGAALRFVVYVGREKHVPGPVREVRQRVGIQSLLSFSFCSFWRNVCRSCLHAGLYEPVLLVLLHLGTLARGLVNLASDERLVNVFLGQSFLLKIHSTQCLHQILLLLHLLHLLIND